MRRLPSAETNTRFARVICTAMSAISAAVRSASAVSLAPSVISFSANTSESVLPFGAKIIWEALSSLTETRTKRCTVSVPFSGEKS